MSERGVCICPGCGCQFSDHKKLLLEREVARLPVSRLVSVAEWIGGVGRRLRQTESGGERGAADA